MSLPWNKVVCLRVVPGSVCATLSQGWPRAKVLASASHGDNAPFTPSTRGTATASAEASHGLATALDAVLLELAQAAAIGTAHLDVELADALVHLDAVEGDFSGQSERQLQSMAVACVTELLADATADHDVRWQLQPGGRHLLIAAIARAHIQGFVEAAARHGLRLRSIQPDFCLQWNRHAAALKPGSSVFAVASGNDAVVAHVQHGAITTISQGGGWLDRGVDAGAGGTEVRVKRLMCGLGLAASTTAGTLDVRIARLLASVGQDEAKQSAFVLVAPETPERALSPRWTVIHREQAMWSAHAPSGMPSANHVARSAVR